MAIRGLENIATEIIKKGEGNYALYRPCRRGSQSGICRGGVVSEEALRVAKDQYSKGEIVLEPGNLEQVSMKIVGDAE